MAISLSFLPETNTYNIDGREYPADAAVDLANRIIRNAIGEESPAPQPEPQSCAPTPRGAVSHIPDEIINYFMPKMLGLDMDDQALLKALIHFKSKHGGAMPSRRQLAIFRRPEIDPAKSTDPNQKSKLEAILDRESRTYPHGYDRLSVAGLGSYRKSNNKRGSGRFAIVGESWGVAIK